MWRRALLCSLCCVGSVLVAGGGEAAWGFHAHRIINRMACFTLPDPLFGFYKRHIDHITDHAVGPDRRRYAVDGEAPRHYIDLDRYVPAGADYRNAVPRRWKDALERYGMDTLQANGIIPWHVELMYGRLVSAFTEGAVDRIVQLSTDMGHYVADAHVPLHTTSNYNGQLTGQLGIHAFWESRIPEQSSSSYTHFVGRAAYIADPLETIWQVVFESHAALDTVLGMERALQADFPADQKFVFVDRGRNTMRIQSAEFTAAYEASMHGMVERRLNASIRVLGSLWYSAWVDAGQPDPLRWYRGAVSDSLRNALEEELRNGPRNAISRPECGGH